MASGGGAGLQQPPQEMMEVDRRVESEESGDEEGKKHREGLVSELSQQSLRDDLNLDNPEGMTSAFPEEHICFLVEPFLNTDNRSKLNEVRTLCRESTSKPS